MWWTKTRRSSDTDARIDALTVRVSQIEAERDELVNLYEKMRTLHARLAKRDQRAEEEVQLPVAPAAPMNPAALRILMPYGNGR